jgi:type IV secretory pathway TraG/TraD family ATPase VirD4
VCLLPVDTPPAKTILLAAKGGSLGALGRTVSFLSGAVVFVNRVIAFFSRHHHLHTARFARLHEIAPLLSPITDDLKTSLLLGRSYLNQLACVRPTKTRRELGNLLVCAPTRGGKGLLAVSQLLTWQHSVVVNDIKGELFNQTAGYRLGPVLMIDPQGLGHRYDPLHVRKTEDALYSSASHLLFQPEEREGRIFTQRATTMLQQMFLASRREGVAPFPYIRFLIQLGLSDTAYRLNTIDPKLATRFLDTRFLNADRTDKFLLSSWGTLTARLQPLLNETVIRSLTHSDFTPAELMCSDRPVTVYLRWKEQDLLPLGPLVRLLWGSLIDELTTTYDNQAGKHCNPVLLLIDEGGRTAIPNLHDAATTVCGRGISIWLAIQSLSQLEAAYGRARANVLRGNMETQLYYRPNDLTTARYLEERLGSVSAYAHSQTLHSGEETSEGRSERPIPLVSKQDIAQLSDSAVIAFHRSHRPLRLTRCDWREYPLLAKRRALVPPKLHPLPPLPDIQLRETLSLASNEFPPGELDDPDDLLDPDMITRDL